MREIRGIVVPLVTPFNADESLNEAALRQIVEYLVSAGVHGLFPSGSQGELYALDKDEKKRTMDVVLEQNNGRAFVMPSTGAITTRESVELTRYAERAGADAVSVITPYFVKPTQDELVAHFCRIAESVSIPVLGYNNPDRTGVNLTPESVARIVAACPTFRGIKDSSGDLSNTMRYIALCPPDFATFMGRDTLIYAGLTYGCVGAVAATANVAPELVVGIYNAYQAGDLALALERQRQLEPLRQAFGLGSFPVVVKDAMEMLGLPAGPCRAPIRSLQDPAREKLIAILKQMGKL